MNREERLKLDGAVDPVLFFDPRDPDGEFSNFSQHGFWLPHPFTGILTWYQDGEHRYQAMKGQDEVAHDYVNRAHTAFDSKKRGRNVDLDPRWGSDQNGRCWYVMLETVQAKAEQNPVVFDALMLTGERFMYEDSPTDDIWGWRFGQDYRGKNLLGLSWMRVRSRLRQGITLSKMTAL